LQGIEWEPVAFFDNKIICDMVEERHKGILAILVSVNVSQLRGNWCMCAMDVRPPKYY
jgi:hypothetical protein